MTSRHEMKPIVLLLGIYVDPVETRMNELLESLERNIANEDINEIHVFVEEDSRDISQKLILYSERFSEKYSKLLKHEKVIAVERGKRTFFSEYFDYANKNLIDKVVVIANSDIYFDHTIGLLKDADLEGVFICLAKYEGIPPKLWDPNISQDVWAFSTPIRVLDSHFTNGCPGCDNVLAYFAHSAGMQVINPCLSIIAYHLDNRTRDRRYGPPIPGLGGLGVPPSTIDELRPNG